MASLDPESAEGVLTLLRDITREREMTVLCSLHQPALAERFCELPQRMRTQLDQLRKLEASDSPSIVPSIFDFGDKQ